MYIYADESVDVTDWISGILIAENQRSYADSDLESNKYFLIYFRMTLKKNWEMTIFCSYPVIFPSLNNCRDGSHRPKMITMTNSVRQRVNLIVVCAHNSYILMLKFIIQARHFHLNANNSFSFLVFWPFNFSKDRTQVIYSYVDIICIYVWSRLALNQRRDAQRVLCLGKNGEILHMQFVIFHPRYENIVCL